MKFPSDLYLQAGLNSTDLANIYGVSRITGYRWLRGTSRSNTPGVGVNIFLQDLVEETTAQVQAAIDAGDLPNYAIAILPPARREPLYKAILNKYKVAR